MSRFTKLWVLLVPAVLTIGLGVIPPASATGWTPVPPTPSDVCGTKQDQLFIPNDDTTDYFVNGSGVGQGTWLSTGGASTVNVVAKNYIDPDQSFALTFNTEANSTCVEAADTVTTEIISCNTTNNGTLVKFTYTNTDDTSDWWHTNPKINVDRWDQGQLTTISMTGRVLDGGQLSASGGDLSDRYGQIFLQPGTYSLKLTTNETPARVLPNRLFVPACGDYKPPAGDPMGGPTPPPNRPKATIGKCWHHRVRVTMDGRQATRTTKYRVVIDPKRGRTRSLVYWVAASKYKSVVYRNQKNRTVIKVYFNGKVVKRYLRGC